MLVECEMLLGNTMSCNNNRCRILVVETRIVKEVEAFMWNAVVGDPCV